jgi:hypothetical protein
MVLMGKVYVVWQNLANPLAQNCSDPYFDREQAAAPTARRSDRAATALANASADRALQPSSLLMMIRRIG